jgi:hypothetical protein
MRRTATPQSAHGASCASRFPSIKFQMVGQAFSRRTLSDGGLFGISRIVADLEFTKRPSPPPRSAPVSRTLNRGRRQTFPWQLVIGLLEWRVISCVRRSARIASGRVSSRHGSSRYGTIDNLPGRVIRSSSSPLVFRWRPQEQLGRVPIRTNTPEAIRSRFEFGSTNSAGPHPSPLPCRNAHGAPVRAEREGLVERLTDGLGERVPRGAERASSRHRDSFESSP